MPLRPTKGINVSLHAISSFTAAETEDGKKGGGDTAAERSSKNDWGRNSPDAKFTRKKYIKSAASRVKHWI